MFGSERFGIATSAAVTKQRAKDKGADHGVEDGRAAPGQADYCPTGADL
jgi:hypothetical protein